ncbi:MAG: flavin reductase family protein [bacterium]|nr:flavin reductase family protein [bacterium]
MMKYRFKTFDSADHSIPELHHLLLGGVAPRPIALVSTISADGVRNLSPFSFFNAFGANPPVVAFSASRRGRDGSLKDTFNNLIATNECVIHAVTYDIAQQTSLASTEYGPEVDEFTKSGLTPIPADLVKPSRMEESPFAMECKLMQMVPLGDGPASGNLAICEVIRFHVAEEICRDGVILPDLIDLVGRNSASFYTRASGAAMFEIEKPIGRKGIGFDALPKAIRESQILSGNNLAQLANCERPPTEKELTAFGSKQTEPLTEQSAKKALTENNPELAWLILAFLARESIKLPPSD